MRTNQLQLFLFKNHVRLTSVSEKTFQANARKLRKFSLDPKLFSKFYFLIEESSQLQREPRIIQTWKKLSAERKNKTLKLITDYKQNS